MSGSSAMSLAAFIDSVSPQRFRVTFKGQPILDDVADPEFATARYLKALGYSGKLLTYFNGTPSIVLEIDRAALLATSEGSATSLRVVKWRPFDKEARYRARQGCVPSPQTGKDPEVAPRP